MRKPASAHESLSHWQICRPSIAAAGPGRAHERPCRDDHSAWVLREVPRQAADLAAQLGEGPPSRRAELRLAVGQLRQPSRTRRGPPSVRRASRSSSAKAAERLADVADRTSRAIGREGGDERGVLASVALADGDDQLLADVARGSRGRCRAPRRARGSETGRARGRRRPGRRAKARSGNRRSSRPSPRRGRAGARCAPASRRAPPARTRAPARAPPSAGVRTPPGRARRSASAPRRAVAVRDA